MTDTAYFVVVNKHIVASNRRDGTAEPPLRISHGRHGQPHYATSVALPEGSRLTYDPAHPLPCGASVWIECPHRPEFDEVANPQPTA